MSVISPSRVQDFILSAMDRRSFCVHGHRLQRVSASAAAWLDAAAFPVLYTAFGNKILRTALENLVDTLAGPNSPHKALLVTSLISPTTIARFLLATGDYENVAPCPFVGMEGPAEVAEAFAIYLAVCISAQTNGPMNMGLFLSDAFGDLAKAAITALDPNAHLIKPKYPTTHAEVKAPGGPQPARKRKVPASLVEESVLRDQTNLATNHQKGKKIKRQQARKGPRVAVPSSTRNRPTDGNIRLPCPGIDVHPFHPFHRCSFLLDFLAAPSFPPPVFAWPMRIDQLLYPPTTAPAAQ
ncbi:hypothetical protein C8R46DRAFT_1209720 [Mycena filopes]|nr:hypothetical protein C8R46DRAFT_1209720 [Mycena filopes]